MAGGVTYTTLIDGDASYDRELVLRNQGRAPEETTMDGATTERASIENFERRRRIQKLRWLGLDHEADLLARAEAPADTHESKLPLPVNFPETD